jgi:protein CpxP
MFLFTNSATRAVAAAALLGAFVFAVPLTVGSTELSPALAAKSLPAHEILADASTSPATTAPAQMAARNDRVESRIRELHNKLHITAAQQIPWDNMVEVMRDNAKTMIDLQKQRTEDAKSMTAVDAVKSYALVIKAHEAGMSKFVPAFQALYDSMSNAQKAIADSMFQNRITTAAAK